MIDTLICPNCKKPIQISQALKKQIEEEVNLDLTKKHQEEMEKAKKAAEEDGKRKAVRDFEINLRKTQGEALEEKQRNKQLTEQILTLAKELREARRASEDRKLLLEKQFNEKEEKLKEEERRRTEEEHRLKDLEKDKKLQDILRINEELRKKVEQGSQQSQGEVMELELEKILKAEFPVDQISEIAKGVRGADILQVVIDKYSRNCGTILWELKNAIWSNAWVTKLKEDQRRAKASVAVLVSVNLPEEIKNFTFKDGIWITNKSLVLSLAWALRMNLGQLHNLKIANTGKNKKTEALFAYLTGIEFKQRVDALVEAFQNMQVDLEREKRWFQTKWSRQEKEIRKIIDNTYGMYGDLQGVTSRSLPEIKILPLKGGEENETA